jgi:predicted dehydrogenase
MAIQKVSANGRKEVRIGMLGCGFMGKCHTNAYKKMPYIYPAAGFMPRLAVLCDKNEKIVGREAARYGYEEFCTDWSELAASGRIDVFDNCGPDPVHVEPSIAVLKSGKHVICEKPMAISVEDARRMRDAARTASGKAMCTFNYRFMPAVRFAKDLIAEGKIGTVYHIRINYLQMAGHDPSLTPDQAWYSAWPHSGCLQGIGSHAIDQCRFLLVLSDEGNAAVLDFESGAIGVLESSVVATGRRNFLSWEINGSKGSLKWDLEHPNSLYVCQEGSGGNTMLGFNEISVTESDHPYVGPWWPHGHNLGWEHGQIIEKFHFLDAVANNKPMSPYNATFEDGYRVAAIIDAMRRSSESGQRIDLRFE